MKTGHSFLVALMFLGPVVADASGTSVRGGGNAIVCFSDAAVARRIDRSPKGEIPDADIGKIVSVEAFDLNVARLPRGLEGKAPRLFPLPAGAAISDFPELLARRFDPYVPGLSRLLRRGRANIPPERVTLRSAALERIRDENDPAIVDGGRCVVATMAAQERRGGLVFLEIDRRLFEHPRHSALSKAVLFLHETLYSLVRDGERPQKDSSNVRRLISRILSLDDLRSADVELLLVELGFRLESCWEGDSSACGGKIDSALHLVWWIHRHETEWAKALQKDLTPLRKTIPLAEARGVVQHAARKLLEETLLPAVAGMNQYTEREKDDIRAMLTDFAASATAFDEPMFDIFLAAADGRGLQRRASELSVLIP